MRKVVSSVFGEVLQWHSVKAFYTIWRSWIALIERSIIIGMLGQSFVSLMITDMEFENDVPGGFREALIERLQEIRGFAATSERKLN